MNSIDAAISQYSITITQLSARLAQAAAVGLLLLSTSALAGETPNSPQELELQGRMTALEQQRNEQANAVVGLVGKMNVMAAELEKLKKAAAECAPKKGG